MDHVSAELERISQGVSEILSGILGLDPDKPLDTSKPMAEMGLDSLLAMDLLAALETKFGIKLEETAHEDHPTISELARHVSKRAEKLRAAKER
jgi:phthiocerol/phenolphthiocerol synthesis type-I polyketide synthase A